MTRDHRWLARLPARAAAFRIRLPWERGLRRAAFARHRAAKDPPLPFPA